MHNILILDDDPNILAALERDLRAPDFYQIEKFTCPSDALGRVSLQQFSVAITDYRMLNMDGVLFLELLRELQPTTVRVLISGNGSQDMLLNAINRAHAFSYLNKPWDKDELVSIVAQAIQEHLHLRGMSELQKRVEDQQKTLAWQWQYLKNSK